jgi:Aldehyde dehydrogenase family
MIIIIVYCIPYTVYYRGISLELGGKSPLIVFQDAHIDSAVDWIITGFLWGSGQVYRKLHTVYHIFHTVKRIMLPVVIRVIS